ncbi:MAG: threonine/serine dehydratase [Gemmatimonadaceae bacterium]
MTSPFDSQPLHDAVVEAHARLRPFIRETPLEESPALGLEKKSGSSGSTVFLKLENLQHTGSFKARGALNRLLCLTQQERGQGVVTASSGNHGAGVAWASAQLGIEATVFVPEQASSAKVSLIERYGATVHRVGIDGLDTELHARDVAASRGATYVSPYNDAAVMAGQGTVAVELATQASSLDALYVAVGGGGLIGGIAAYLAHALPSTRIIGALPEHSPVMERSIRAGHVIEMESLPTLSDGTAGGIESDSVTFPVCEALVDEWMLVTEQEIAQALRRCIDAHHMLIEGSAGVALAAYERNRARHVGERVGIVLCGANISVDRLRQVLET